MAGISFTFSSLVQLPGRDKVAALRIAAGYLLKM
jgi:hypothetical protein